MVVVACALAVVGLASMSITDGVTLELLPPVVALLMIAALYMLAEVVLLNFEMGRHGLAVSISDLPLVLGVFLLPPPLVLAACVAGTLSIRSRRTSQPLKTAFNLSVTTAEIGIAGLLADRLPLDLDVAADPSWWWGPFAIVLAVNVLGAPAGLVALRHLDSPLSAQDSMRFTVTLLVSGAFSATLAVIALQVLAMSTYGIILLLIVAAVLALIYRSYAAMLRRHADLGRLMSSTQTLSEAHATGDLAEALVNEAKALVRADKAFLLRGDHPKLDAILDGGQAQVLDARTRDPLHRRWLAEHRHVDALLVQVGGRNRIGYLVMTDRLGHSGSFGAEDLRRAITLVRHAEALWANGLLLQRLRHDATHDSLTGLINRPHLLYTLAQRLQATVVATDSIAPDRCDSALLLLDLDRFNEVNDTLGHQAGDAMLVVIGERLRVISPGGSQVARLGGDEFAVLLPASSIAEAMQLAHRVHEGLREPIALAGTRVELHCAIGLSFVPHDGSDANTVLRRADVAMYASKRNGRITRYHPSLDTASVDRLEILGDLRRSLDDGGVRPWFQPKIDLRTGTVVGFEALARWEHPTRGMVFPDEFVPLAEQGGLSTPLTAAILNAALQECTRWGAWAGGLGVAVNVPARQLEETDFARMVTRALRETGISPVQLTLEITEGSAVPGHLEALRSLSDLREVGVRISVDDFGTGYSALGYLHRLPVDEVKIDKSFVLPMRTEAQAAAIVSTIIDLSRRLRLQTVAEGVEEIEVAKVLFGLGCTTAQGFMVSRPMPAHRVLPWLRQYTPAGQQPLTEVPHQARPANSQELP